MEIKVEYTAQLRDAAGVQEESYEFAAKASFHDLVAAMGARHGDALMSLLVNDRQQLHGWILADRSGSLIQDADTELVDGDVIRFLSPISGG